MTSKKTTYIKDEDGNITHIRSTHYHPDGSSTDYTHKCEPGYRKGPLGDVTDHTPDGKSKSYEPSSSNWFNVRGNRKN